MNLNLTPMQIIGIVLVINGALIGSTAQLTDLFGPATVKYIVAIASLGNSILGGVVTMFSSQGAQLKSVLAMPGVEHISVNNQANAALATIAVDPASNKIAPTQSALQEVTATAKAAAAIVALLVCFMALPQPSSAQGLPKVRPLTGNIVEDIKAAQGGKPSGLTGAAVTDVQNFFNAQLLPDLQYALKLSQASKNAVTGDCYQAWIDIITTQQTAVKNPDGTEIAMPDPHVITEFEKLVELRNALQPESTFMVKCSPVASMVKRDIAGFIGIVISGGAGIATLVPGL